MSKGRKYALTLFVLFMGNGGSMWIRGHTGSSLAFAVALLCSAAFGWRLVAVEEGFYQ
jgi:hypothetical protein